MDKELGGVPVWMWAAGAGVAVLGFLYIRSHSSQTSQSSGQGSGGGKSSDNSTFRETITDLQSAPKKVTTHKPAPKSHPAIKHKKRRHG